SVVDQKIQALDAHTSQFYEWLPWINNYKGNVPEAKEERVEWLKNQRQPELTPEKRARLTGWYPEDRIFQARHVESFEICEYGSRPNREDILRLFPMIPGNGK